MEEIAEQIVRSRTEDILIAPQSNTGLPHLVGDHFEYDVCPQGMAAHAVRLRELAVDLIGACCGSTPQHVAAMRDALTA